MQTQIENKVNVSVRNPQAVIEKLRNEADKNPAFNAVCHIFAIRERARQQVTLSNLRITMAREGFHFSRSQYEGVLKFMASLGIGKLDVDSKGQVRALKEIGITLQSIGLVTVGRQRALEKLHINNEYKHLAPVSAPLQVLPPLQPPTKEQSADITMQPTAPSYPAVLTVLVDGKPVEFKLPRQISIDELGKLLVELYAQKSL